MYRQHYKFTLSLFDLLNRKYLFAWIRIREQVLFINDLAMTFTSSDDLKLFEVLRVE